MRVVDGLGRGIDIAFGKMDVESFRRFGYRHIRRDEPAKRVAIWEGRRRGEFRCVAGRGVLCAKGRGGCERRYVGQEVVLA